MPECSKEAFAPERIGKKVDVVLQADKLGGSITLPCVQTQAQGVEERTCHEYDVNQHGRQEKQDPDAGLPRTGREEVFLDAIEHKRLFPSSDVVEHRYFFPNKEIWQGQYTAPARFVLRVKLYLQVL